MVKGYALSELGEPEKAIPLMESGLMGWNQMGSKIADVQFYAMLAHAYRKIGRNDDVSHAIICAHEKLQSSGERVFESELHRLEGLLGLDANAAARAEAVFRRACKSPEPSRTGAQN